MIDGRKEVEISYLQFVDDTILLLSKNDQNLRNLLIVLEIFCTTLGLKMNRGKSSIQVLTPHKEKRRSQLWSGGGEVGRWAVKYLGLILGCKP